MLNKLSAEPYFKKLLGAMGLQARGTGGVDSASTGQENLTATSFRSTLHLQSVIICVGA